MDIDKLTRLLTELKEGAFALVLSLPGRDPEAELRLALTELELYVGLLRKALEAHDGEDAGTA